MSHKNCSCRRGLCNLHIIRVIAGDKRSTHPICTKQLDSCFKFVQPKSIDNYSTFVKNKLTRDFSTNLGRLDKYGPIRQIWHALHSVHVNSRQMWSSDHHRFLTWRKVILLEKVRISVVVPSPVDVWFQWNFLLINTIR